MKKTRLPSHRAQPRRLSAKNHATLDALGNPTGFHLTPGPSHNLEGVDALLPHCTGQATIADRAYDAQDRVTQPVLGATRAVVIPSRRTNKEQLDYVAVPYKARHVIENFFAGIKQYRSTATRYDNTAANFLSVILLAGSAFG